MTRPKARILVIDDEHTIRELLRNELGRQGYAVDVAADGDEGVSKVRQEKYDIVVSDIKMPRMDGMQALAEIKNASPETEVIMITGYATVENAVQAMKGGAYDFVQKPFNLEELSVLIEKALEKSELKALVALYESSKAVFSTFKLEELFPIMINLLKNVVQADEIALFLLDNQNQVYLAAATFSLVYYPMKGDFLSLAERLSASGRSSEEPVILNAPLAGNYIASGLFRNSDIGAVAVHPITLKGKNLGMLVLARTAGRMDFSGTDLRNLSIFVSQIAQSIDNTKLYEKLGIKISELENAYSQLEQTKKQLNFAEKMSIIGHMATSIAHRFSRHIGTMRAEIDALLSGGSLPPGAVQRAEAVRDELAECDETVENILAFSASPQGKQADIRVNGVLEEILQSFEHAFASQKIAVTKDLGADLPPVAGYAGQLRQAFASLVENEIHSFSDAPAEGRTISVKTSAVEDMVQVEIAADGRGIDPADMERIFDPFFAASKEESFELSFGLSIANTIIRQHNGKLHVMSTPKEGMTFIITLPSH